MDTPLDKALIFLAVLLLLCSLPFTPSPANRVRGRDHLTFEGRMDTRISLTSEAAPGPVPGNKTRGSDRAGSPVGAGKPGIVYGYLPYWAGGSYEPKWSSLTHLAWHSVGIGPDGSLRNPHDWPAAAPVARAHKHGVNVSLSASCFNPDDIDAILARHINDTASALLEAVRLGNADGISLDLENVRAVNSVSGGSNKVLLEKFLERLHQVFKDADPEYHVGLILPPVDWRNIYSNPSLADHADSFLMMGYGYHHKGSSNTGPVGPVNDPATFDVAFGLNSSKYGYLNYLPPDKLVLVAPWYGVKWATETGERGSPVLGVGTSYRLQSAVREAALYGRLWDVGSGTPWYRYRSEGRWYQCWYEDASSFAEKIDYAEAVGLQGIGVWALGYEGDRGDVWREIDDKVWNRKELRVVIDPGHGYYFDGSSGKWQWQRTETHGVREDTNNVKLSLELFELLKETNAEVFTTRELDLSSGNGESGLPKWKEGAYQHLKDRSSYDPGVIVDGHDDLYIRPYFANEIGADVLISVHSNALDGQQRGFYTIYGAHPERDAPDIRDWELASVLHPEISGAISGDMPDRGAVRDLDLCGFTLCVLRESNMAANLLEIGFHDNATDAALLKDVNFRKRAARGIYRGLTKYLGLEEIERDDEAPVISVLTPKEGAVVGKRGTIAGAVEDESGIKVVKIRIMRSGDRRYWNGENWTAGERWVDAEMVNGTDWRYELSSLAGDDYAVTARASDPYGNVALTKSLVFSVDLTPPRVNISKPEDGGWYGALTGIRGSAEDDHSVGIVEIRVRRVSDGAYLNGTDWKTGECWFPVVREGRSRGSWRLEAPPGAFPDDSYDLTARAFDRAGNLGLSPEITVDIDRTGPGLVVERPIEGTVTFELGNISGKAFDPGSVSSVSLSILRTTPEVLLYWNGGNWTESESWVAAALDKDRISWEYELPDTLPEGTYRVNAKGADAVGNAGKTGPRNLIIDRTPPEIAVLSPINSSTVNSTRNMTFAGWDFHSSVRRVEARIRRKSSGAYLSEDGWTKEESWLKTYPVGFDAKAPGIAPWRLWRLPANGAGDAGGFDPGEYEIVARAVDEAGNRGRSGTVRFVLDTAPPAVVGSDPPDLSADVHVTSNIRIEFDEPMDTGTVGNSLSFAPSPGYGVDWSADGRTLRIHPVRILSYGTTYRIVIGAAARDTAGNSLEEAARISFTTETDTVLIGIRGRVVEGDGGKPVSNATVRLSGSFNDTVVTDANGVFAFSGAPEGGDLEIAVSKEGFREWSRYPLPVENESVDLGTISLKPEGAEPEETPERRGGSAGIYAAIVAGLVVVSGGFSVVLYLGVGRKRERRERGESGRIDEEGGRIGEEGTSGDSGRACEGNQCAPDDI